MLFRSEDCNSGETFAPASRKAPRQVAGDRRRAVSREPAAFLSASTLWRTRFVLGGPKTPARLSAILFILSPPIKSPPRRRHRVDPCGRPRVTRTRGADRGHRCLVESQRLKKYQTPNSKLQINSKFQTEPKHPTVGVWDLKFIWSLEFEIWSFSPQGSPPLKR